MPAGAIALSVLSELSRLLPGIVIVAEVLALPTIPLLDLPDLFSKRPKSRKFVHCCWQHSTKLVAFCQPLAEPLTDELVLLTCFTLKSYSYIIMLAGIFRHV